MKTFVSPCNKLGFIPIAKNFSTSMVHWLSNAGWIIKEFDSQIPYFFLIRSPSQRLLSSVAECVWQTLDHHGISIAKQNEMLDQGKIINDLHTLSVSERLHNLNIDTKHIYCINAELHLETMIKCLFDYLSIQEIKESIPLLNSTNQTKSPEILALSEKIILKQYPHFRLGLDIDQKIYDAVNQTTKYYRLEYRYIEKTKKQPKLENVLDIATLQNTIHRVLQI
jgi:hypothetical protein